MSYQSEVKVSESKSPTVRSESQSTQGCEFVHGTEGTRRETPTKRLITRHQSCSRNGVPRKGSIRTDFSNSPDRVL